MGETPEPNYKTMVVGLPGCRLVGQKTSVRKNTRKTLESAVSMQWFSTEYLDSCPRMVRCSCIFFCAPSTWPWVYDSFPKRKHEAKQHQSTGLKQHPQCFPFNKCGFVWGDLLLSMNHFSFKPTKITSWGHFLIYSTYFSTLFLLANPNNQIDRGWQHLWLWFFSWWFHACVASNRCAGPDVYVVLGKTF